MLKRIISILGVFMVLLSCLIVPASAASLSSVVLPDGVPLTGVKEGFTDILYYKDVTTGKITNVDLRTTGLGYFTSSLVSYDRDNGYYKVVLYADASLSWAKYVYDGSWTTGGASTSGSYTFYVEKSEDVYYSHYDLNYADGSPFFPLPQVPLAEVILGKVKVAMPSMVATLVGAMKVLLLCGVGCLALLAVLKLFGKVLYRFL